MEQVTTFLHNGSIGDVWAAIPAMKKYYEFRKRKVMLYLVNGQKAFYYAGATHPTVDPHTGDMVMLNEAMINMMIPLLKEQEFIYDVKMWSNQPIQINLNVIRETFVNMPYHSLSRWYFYVFPELACDLSRQSIFVPDSEKDLAKNKIILTRSERYLSPDINYRFLKKYEKDILFCGTELEWHIFRLRYDLNIERLIINDFLELAQALKQCKFHISNQTQAFQISEGMKIPRIVELCREAPNVEPIGENAFEFYAQSALQHYVAYLNGETEKPQLSGVMEPSKLSI